MLGICGMSRLHAFPKMPMMSGKSGMLTITGKTGTLSNDWNARDECNALNAQNAWHDWTT